MSSRQTRVTSLLLPLAVVLSMLITLAAWSHQLRPAEAITPTPSITPTTFTPTATQTPSGALPDLIVLGMGITLETGDSCAWTSTALGIRVYVKNVGTAAAGAFDVDVNGAVQSVGGLAAGDTASLWFTGYIWPGTDTATVDATHLVVESNEANNTLQSTPAIPTLPPTCTPTTTPTPTGTATPTMTATFTSTPSALGGISGTVTNTLGTPIAGAWVYASRVTCCYWNSAYSGADGTYHISGLPAGAYQVVAQAGGYATEYYNDAYDSSAATAVTVTGGIDTTAIDFALADGARIAGKVTNNFGTPIAGASVHATSDGWCCGYGSASTAPDGTYLIDTLATGNYRVEASAYGYPTQFYNETYDWPARTLVSATGGATTPNIDFALGPGGTITGTVRNAVGTPIAGASLTAESDACNCSVGGIVSGADGSYTIGTLAPGAYRVRAAATGYAAEYYNGSYLYSSATLVTVTGGVTTSNIDFALDAGGKISGTVKNDLGTPIAGASINACPDTGWWCGYATTGQDGTYVVNDLAPLNYRIRATAAGYAGEFYNGTYDYNAAALLSVTIGVKTTGIDFSLAPEALISGTVRNVLGTPIAGAAISAYADGCAYCSGYATSGADGTYLIGGLPAGGYRVQASATGYAPQYYDGVFDSSTATLVTATSGVETTGIDFALPLGGKISGTITNALGTPIAGAQVSANRDACCGSGWTTTATDGTYLFSSLVPGNYRLQASASGYVEQYYDGVYDWSAATLVSASSGIETSGIDFTLATAGKIAGKVTNALGTPVAGAQVWANRDVCCGSGAATTSGDGTYTIDGLAPAGDYRVQAEASGYAPQYYDDVYDYSAATLLAVAGGATTPNVDFALPVEGRISGTVKNALGTPIPNVWVSASTGVCCLGGVGFSAVDGTYTIGGLAPGSYRVYTNASGYVTQYWDHVADAPSATLVPVSSGAETTGIDFDLVQPDPDNSSTPKIITWFPFLDSRNTTTATLEGGEPHTCGNIGATIWYRLTAPISPPGTSSIAIDTAGSDFNTAIAIYTIDPAVPSPPGALLQLACSPNWGHNSELTFTTEPGTTYYIQVGGQSGATGNLVVHADADADADGLRDPVETNTGVYVDANDTGTNPATTDTDGDGCRDGAEVLHWDLDPVDPWNFYSVPIPALFAAPNPTTRFRDATVSAGDAQAVFGYFKKAAKTGTLEYEQDLNLNGIKDGIEYDRSVVVGSPGASGPPNGTISASDAQLAFAQFKKGYKC